MIANHPTLWVDFETGGFEADVHSPLSFAMMETRGNVIVNEWYTQIRQEPFVLTAEAMRINKLDIQEPGLNYQEFKVQYMARMNAWFFGGVDPSGKPVIRPNRDNMPFFGGQNCPFDRGFLRKVLNSKFDSCHYLCKDLVGAAMIAAEAGLFEPENFKLVSITRALNIKVEGELHNALMDVKVTFACWQRLKEMMER